MLATESGLRPSNAKGYGVAKRVGERGKTAAAAEANAIWGIDGTTEVVPFPSHRALAAALA